MEGESIGEVLRRLRQEREMSQRKLAELSGVNRAYINQIEHGKVKSITLTTARKFADALNLPPSTFFGESPESSLDLQKLENIIQVAVYDDFPVYAGKAVAPVDYAYLYRVGPAPQSLEGYRVSGDCLRPEIQNGDIVIVDREGDIDSGNIVMALVGNEVQIGRLRKIAGDFFLENNHRRFQLEECSIIAPVIQVVRRLK